MAAIGVGALLACSGPALPSSGGSITLDEGWRARWVEGPERTESSPEAGFATARTPVVESGWPRLRTLWLRRRLPELHFRDPVLLASMVDQTLEVWVDGARIYRLGDLDGRTETFATAGWLHLVSLPEDCGGKELALRIRSTYSRAGVGEIRIGARDALVREVLVRDLGRVVLGLLALFAGVLEWGVFLRRREQRLHLAFGGFALAIGAFLLSQTSLAQLVADAPMFWTYVVFASLYLTPVGVLAFVEELFEPGPATLLRRARHVFAAYAVIAPGLAGLGWVSLTRTLPPFLVFLGGCAVLAAVLTLRAASGGSREGRILLLGMSALLVATVNDILVSVGAVSWLFHLIDEATFVFLLSLGGIAVTRYGAIHRRATLDGLTGLSNHGAFVASLDELLASRRAADFPISLVMMDVDHFKLINDRFGHPIGDEALRRIAIALGQAARSGDVAARYGGEEFALVLRRCSSSAARSAAERVRAAIAAIRISEAPGLVVTASFGIAAAAAPHAAVDGREMIARADEALYAAKTNGRDRVCVHGAVAAAG